MAGAHSDIELFRHKFQARKSTVQTRRQQAVCVRDACKHYGTKKEPLVILDGLNMTVPKGVIYGLLGASGCGKTTLLNCVLGRTKMDSGEIWVLGGKPGSRGSGVPGPRTGYMPQDLAQYGEFTIRETLKFYGWITNMTNGQVEERTGFLAELLMLPDVDKMVKELSGGQQRRVSLASALLHEPELLVLDEPTVGVDPILREVIWNHFVDIAASGQTTIIITTHYIEETRQADLIALMRGGYLLAEESPDKLMRTLDATSLEDVFLKVSIVQNIGRRRRSTIAQVVTKTVTLPGVVNRSVIIEEDEEDLDKTNDISGEFGDNVSEQGPSSRRESVASRRVSVATRRLSIMALASENDSDEEEYVLPELPPQLQPPVEISDYFPMFKRNNIEALMWKNLLWMLRNGAMMVFLVVLAAVQVTFQCLCIGGDPTDLPVAVVNYEMGNDMHCDSPISCNSTTLSCHYLKYLEKRSLILVPYDSEDSATQSVLTGKTYASVVMQHNYSAALYARIQEWASPTLWNIKYSKVDVLPDISNYAIASFLRVAFYDTFKDFIRDYLVTCDIDQRLLTESIKMETPVYGDKNPDFTEFVTPGLLMSIAFTLGGCLTAFGVMIERQEGTFERYLVAGIKETELLFAHFVTEFLICLIQLVLAIVIAFYAFNMPMLGSATLASVLVVFCGICGMSYGFAISCASNDERLVNNVIMGGFIPIITLSGIMWPVEGMHYVLQYIAIIIPLTQPTESLRSIMQKGWGLSTDRVYLGFIILGVWTILFMAVSVLSVKYKKR